MNKSIESAKSIGYKIIECIEGESCNDIINTLSSILVLLIKSNVPENEWLEVIEDFLKIVAKGLDIKLIVNKEESE